MSWREELAVVVDALNPDKVFILTDSGVAPLFRHDEETTIMVAAGEGSKSFGTLEKVLGELVWRGATRRSLLVNIGGGMVSDLGGLAAGLFMRGIRHVNIPTTLLAMADAAIGGKTAIDFCGLKNQVGLFKMPERVITDSSWLSTLPWPLVRDGLAEVVKTAMLDGRECYEACLELPDRPDAASLGPLALRAAAFKQEIVDRDPREQGLRRILNLGHTAGHAFESLAARRGVTLSHGEAVAHGIAVALALSRKLLNASSALLDVYAARILLRFYNPLPTAVRDADALMEIMAHDKKNPAYGKISFILLRDVGEPETMVADAAEIKQALADVILIRDKR